MHPLAVLIWICVIVGAGIGILWLIFHPRR